MRQRNFDDYPHRRPGEAVSLPEEVVNRLDRAERRLVRIETRCTNALRYLGLVPGAEVPPPGKGKAVLDDDGNVVVTGPDVTIRDIAMTAVLLGRTGSVNILFHNRVWGVIHIDNPDHYPKEETHE